MSGGALRRLKKAASSITTPPTNYVEPYLDTADGLWGFKDEAAARTIIGSTTSVGYTAPMKNTGTSTSLTIATDTATDSAVGAEDSGSKSFLDNKQLANAMTADFSSSSATAIPGSLINAPVGGFAAGTTYRWTLEWHKTESTSRTITFTLYIGTNGTSSDTSVATLTLATDTTAQGEAFIEIEFTVRTTGSSATAEAVVHVTGSATGVLNASGLQESVIAGSMSTFNSTTAGQKLVLYQNLGVANEKVVMCIAEFVKG